jgi:hypothetical protein
MLNNPSPLLTDSSPKIKDVKEKLEDLAYWLEKLKDCLVDTAADGNPEKMKRRAQLEKFAPHILLSYPSNLIVCRSFDAIEKKSQALLEKGRVANISDEDQGFQALIRLVEELQQATLIYQVGSRVARFGQS